MSDQNIKTISRCCECPFLVGPDGCSPVAWCNIMERSVSGVFSGFPADCPLRSGDIVIRLSGEVEE